MKKAKTVRFLDRFTRTLNQDVRDFLIQVRLSIDKQDDGPIHFAVMDDLVRRRYTAKRAVIGIATHGCSFARRAWGACAVCGHGASTLWDASLSAQQMIADFDHSIALAMAESPTSLCLYTSGSFLDENELPMAVREHILSCVAQTNVLDVFVESLPQFVTTDRVDGVTKHLSGKRLCIGMGLDSSCDEIRATLFQRDIRLRAYVDALDVCRRHAVVSTAYVVLGNPFLSRALALADASRSIEEAFELGFSTVSIEPVAMQEMTAQAAFHRAGLYDIPTIWDVAAVLLDLPESVRCRTADLLLGGQVFTPLPSNALTACVTCMRQISELTPFVTKAFWQAIPLCSDGACCRVSVPPHIPHGLVIDDFLRSAVSRLHAFQNVKCRDRGKIIL